ncbi:hypothetical protein [Streptomyces sp. gCLA4]|uniref:hypothetical protein n=1 Tax=Streptomyces sp. gCLA4 TaxID=1873416 RepID=UPI0016031814|nr:hypothetical protein [Streptomyces sp. gCLA4]
MDPISLLATAAAPVPAADTPVPTAFLVGAAITIIVQLVMGTVTLAVTWKMTRTTHQEQRDQLELEAAHARAADLRAAQYTATLAFLKAAHRLVAAAGDYSTRARPMMVVYTDAAEGYDEWVNDLPSGRGEAKVALSIVAPTDGLREVAALARDALEDVRLACGPGLDESAHAVYGAAVDVAYSGMVLADTRHKFPNVATKQGGWEESVQVVGEKKNFQANRKAFGDLRREFSALVRKEMWDVA